MNSSTYTFAGSLQQYFYYETPGGRHSPYAYSHLAEPTNFSSYAAEERLLSEIIFYSFNPFVYIPKVIYFHYCALQLYRLSTRLANIQIALLKWTPEDQKHYIGSPSLCPKCSYWVGERILSVLLWGEVKNSLSLEGRDINMELIVQCGGKSATCHRFFCMACHVYHGCTWGQRSEIIHPTLFLDGFHTERHLFFSPITIQNFKSKAFLFFLI